MLAATERLQKTSDRLQVGKQQLAETEVRRSWRRALSRGACGLGVEVLLCRAALTAAAAAAALPPAAAPPPRQDLGVSILQDLARQRETIVHARDTLHGADDNISRARKLLGTMSRRIVANKIIMFGIAAFLLAAIVLIIYVKLK